MYSETFAGSFLVVSTPNLARKAYILVFCQDQLLLNLKLPGIVLSVYDYLSSSGLNKRTFFVSGYEVASKFSARCARRPLLTKNIAKLQETWLVSLSAEITTSGPEKPISVYIFARVSLPLDPKP